MKLHLLNPSETFKTCRYFTFLFLIFAIIGCSGEDDSVTDEPDVVDEPAQTGVFIDSEVAGLNYWTQTQSGTTNSNGEFKYLEGEEVTFSVGNIEIGSGAGSSVMSPVSIATTSNASVGSPEVMNIAAFLQSLDSDNNPSNGINIEASAVEAISVSEIDFTQPITQLLGEIVAEVNAATGSNLVPVYPSSAAEHLSESLGETYESEDYTFEYFVPLLESHIEGLARTALHWVHETDNNGRLVKSYMYERRPYRLINEIVYDSWNELGQPTSFKRSYMENGAVVTSTGIKVIYSEDHRASEFSYFSPANAPSPISTQKFIAYDEKNRYTEKHYYNHDGVFQVRDVFVLSEAGNRLSETRYSTQTGTNQSDILYSFQYEYNAAGEVKRYNGTESRGNVVVDFFYRDDHTLEKSVHNLVKPNGSERQDVYFYDENEKATRIVITEGDYVSDYISLYPDGSPHVVETYFKDFLYEIVTFEEDGSSVWKTISEEDNSYKLEYKDAEGNIYKTEFNDAEGNLLSTQQ